MYITTFTGRKFEPLNPREDDINILDIAHSLSQQVRFTGHTKRPLTIAEHSFNVSRLCLPDNALWGLLHDASEAYLVDLPRPIKHHPAMVGFREIEREIQAAICRRFGLSDFEPESVKAADEMMLGIEARDLMNTHGDAGWGRWIDPVRHSKFDMRAPMRPISAEAVFLARFEALTK